MLQEGKERNDKRREEGREGERREEEREGVPVEELKPKENQHLQNFHDLCHTVYCSEII